MYPQNPQINPYDPKTLDALGEAFDATWVVLQARDPFRDFDKDNELKTELSHKLSALAADGVTDAIELREWPLRAYQAIGKSCRAGYTNARHPLRLALFQLLYCLRSGHWQCFTDVANTHALHVKAFSPHALL
jgi:hypothetical protein